MIYRETGSVLIMNTRDKIVQCAFQLFLEKGLTDVSIRDIMERVGVTKAGFFSHFTNKDALVECVINDYIAVHINSKVQQLYASTGSIKDKLEALFTTGINSGDEGPMVMLLLEGVKKHPLIKEIYNEFTSRKLEFIRESLRKGQESGEIRKDVDISEISQFISYYHEGIVTSEAISANKQIGRSIETAVGFILAVISKVEHEQ